MKIRERPPTRTETTVCESRGRTDTLTSRYMMGKRKGKENRERKRLVDFVRMFHLGL